jgi:hypothetical protein
MIIPDDKKLPLLMGMKVVLSSPDRWTKDNYARDNEGIVADPSSSHAVCWCTLGAGYKAAATLGFIDVGFVSSDFDNEIGELLIDCGPVRGAVPQYANEILVAAWNDVDARTYDDVIKAIDCAIDKLK